MIAAVVTALVLAALAGRPAAPRNQQQNDTLRIGEARSLPDGTQVTLAGKAVTRTLGDRYYVAEPDRSAGIAVLLPGPTRPGRCQYPGAARECQRRETSSPLLPTASKARRRRLPRWG